MHRENVAVKVRTGDIIREMMQHLALGDEGEDTDTIGHLQDDCEIVHLLE